MFEGDMTDKLIDYERGNLHNKQEIVRLFQALIDTGLAWRLQGSYGRMAADLIRSGDCKPKGESP